MSLHADFIRANTAILAPPHTPEIKLHLAHEIVPIWRMTEEELQAEGIAPPFWAFAWAGGQALARHVLDHPALVQDQRVLDFGCGSGLVAIAAMKAGAASASAIDIDPMALSATRLNAALNGVAVETSDADVIGSDQGWGAVLVGDMCYERDLANRVMQWLRALAARGSLVLLGDPGRTYLPRTGLDALATYEVATTRELEDREVRRTAVYRVAP